MKFKTLASYFSQLDQTPSRNKMTEILAALLRQASAEEADKICYLSLGRLAPSYAAIEFNLAEKLMIRVVARAFNAKEEQVRKSYKKSGDLGEVGFSLKKTAGNNNGEVAEVFQTLYKIATDAGQGSVERKINLMAKLLAGLDPLSAKYVIRIPLGKLRLGFSDLTIMDALSWMVGGDKSKRTEIETAFNVQADIGLIAKTIKSKGLKGLKSLKAQIGVPIMPALCQRLPNVQEMIKKMGKVAAEPKYDGTRLQVHFSRNPQLSRANHLGGVTGMTPKEKEELFDFQPKYFVRIFTRNLENVTPMFPDIVEALDGEVKAREVILDGEAIGFNPKTQEFLPFQETIKRKRKYEVADMAKEIPLKYFCFDVLYKDGQDLLATQFSKRREILEKTLSANNKRLIISPQIISDNPEELRRYHDEQIHKGLEGIVVKKWQGTYDPGRRGYNWVKFKQETGKKGGGLADTLDCVIMGYYRGRGKRAAFGIGGFLVGVREKEGRDRFLTISKVGTGLSDELWRETRRRCNAVKVNQPPKQYDVNKLLYPDVWCEPKIVVEIEADNITRSPVHTAKYALRFPRLIRFRDDKSPEEATTLKEAEKLYRLQQK